MTFLENIQLGERILVVGATNRVDSLDTALRRPGRFDRELEIGIPNAAGRREILSILLQQMPHSLTEEEISTVASITHGYVGADMSALCQEAALKVLKRVKNSLPSSSTTLPLDQLVITLEDIKSAMSDILPSAMREVTLDIPKVRWNDIGGYNDIKQKLREAIEWPLLVFPSPFFFCNF